MQLRCVQMRGCANIVTSNLAVGLLGSIFILVIIQFFSVIVASVSVSTKNLIDVVLRFRCLALLRCRSRRLCHPYVLLDSSLGLRFIGVRLRKAESSPTDAFNIKTSVS